MDKHTYTEKGSLPACDLCGKDARYDANIPHYHVWGNVCQKCFDSFECELGEGHGQEFVVRYETLDKRAKKRAFKVASKYLHGLRPAVAWRDEDLLFEIKDNNFLFTIDGKRMVNEDKKMQAVR